MSFSQLTRSIEFFGLIEGQSYHLMIYDFSLYRVLQANITAYQAITLNGLIKGLYIISISDVSQKLSKRQLLLIP